jgi:16S rRNA (guanine527-N7)-methyltransferase
MRDSEIREHARQLGLELGEPTVRALDRYVGLLQKWNRRINLTGTRDERELIRQHLIDSLAVVPHVPTQAATMLDVGSGAGLPGAVVAMACPALRVTALEPIHKKHAFLAAVQREVPIPNFVPLAMRDTEHRAGVDFELYDVAVSRATFALGEWLSRALELVVPGGLVLAMEGAEAQDLPPGAMRHPYALANRTRAIVTLRRP